MKEMSIKIQEVAYHRNGVAGEGFYAVRFQWSPEPDHEPELEAIGIKSTDKDGFPRKDENFLAIVFDKPGQCAVIGLDRIPSMGIAFAQGNSWRGDHFEDALRERIRKGDLAGGVRVGPFCLPT